MRRALHLKSARDTSQYDASLNKSREYQIDVSRSLAYILNGKSLDNRHRMPDLFDH